MQEVLSITSVIVALGAVQCTLIFLFVLWGIGIRGIIGSLLAIIFGIGVVLAKAPSSAIEWNLETGIKIVSQEEVQKLASAREDSTVKEEIAQALQSAPGNSLGNSTHKNFLTNSWLVTAVMSDLKKGLGGIFFLIPFLLVDLFILTIFRVLDLGWYRVEWISLPLKVLLFLSVDGVGLVARAIFGGA